MLLDEFIRDTLVAIINGVVASQNNIRSTGAEITPRKYDPASEIEQSVKGNHTYDVDFEIELMDGVSAGGKKGIGVALGSVNAGIEKTKGGASTSNTKVKFTIPITYPSNK